MALSPLKMFFLAALFWLPAAFFLWFALASAFAWPVGWLLEPLLTGVFPQIFSGVEQNRFSFEVQTRVLADMVSTGGRIGILELTINPMIYGYGLPLAAGLVMASPISGRQRTLQLSASLLAIILVQLWGCFWQALKMVQYDLGDRGAELLSGTWLSAEIIGLAYQMGYLILPAVAPIALWIFMNQRFIEMLTGGRLPGSTRPKEPDHG